MKKITILLLGLLLLTGCLGQSSLYLKNKELIDNTGWKTCVKTPGNYGGPSTGKKMDLMTALNLADKAGCFNGKRVSNINCNLLGGGWEFYVETKLPINSTDISHCYVSTETDEVTKVKFGVNPYLEIKVPELNLLPGDRQSKPKNLEVGQ